MQFLKTSSALLAVSLLVPQTLLYAAPYPLSNQSKNSVIVAATLAGIVGGIAGYAISPEQPTIFKQSIWDKIKAFPWCWVLVPATIASTAVGFITYSHTPEKLLEGAENAALALEHDATLATMNNPEKTFEAGLDELKNMNAHRRWPLRATADNMKSLLARLESIKTNLLRVAQSGITYLSTIAKNMLSTIDKNIAHVRDWINQLSNNKSFLQEANLILKEEIREARAAECAANVRAAIATTAYVLKKTEQPQISVEIKI